MRWGIEQCFEAGKTELGMAHYEVRKYPGWHHHMLTTTLAHCLLWHLKRRLGKKAPALTIAEALAGTPFNMGIEIVTSRLYAVVLKNG